MSWYTILRIAIFVVSLFLGRGTGQRLTDWLEDGQERRKARREERRRK